MTRLTPFLTALSLPLLAAAQGDWTYRNPLPAAEPYLGIGYGNGTYVAVGWGDIATSPDGRAWNTHPKPSESSLFGVAYGNGMFVAVGSKDIAGSADGLSWRTVAPAPSVLRNVTYAAGLFVAVGDTILMTSPDGVAWTRRASVPGFWKSVAFGNGRYVAVGAAKLTLTSTDGVAWTEHAADTSLYFNGVAFGNGRFVAVNYDHPYVSEDGIRWTRPAGAVDGWFEDIVYGGGRFVGAIDGGAAWSADGLVWTRSAAEEWNTAITHGNGGFVMVGRYGSLQVSGNGEAWEKRHSGRRENLAGLAFGGDRFVAVSDSVILTSEDGIAWTQRFSKPGAGLQGIAWHGGRFAAVGAKGGILASSDGLAWAPAASPTDSGLMVVASTPRGFLAGGRGGILLESPDGIAWSALDTIPCQEVKEIARFGDVLVAIGQVDYVESGSPRFKRVVFLSRDGKSWEPALDGKAWGNAASGNGRLVVGGNHDTAYATEDGSTWKLVKLPKPIWLGPVRYFFVNGRFLANWTGGWFHSTDGLDWIAATRPMSSNYISAIVFGKGIYAGAGSVGTIVTAPDPISGAARRPGRGAPWPDAKLRQVRGGWEIRLRGKALDRPQVICLYDAAGRSERKLAWPAPGGAVIRGAGAPVNFVAARIWNGPGEIIIPLARE